MMNIISGKTRDGLGFGGNKGVCENFSIQVEACVLLLGFLSGVSVFFFPRLFTQICPAPHVESVRLNLDLYL
jgi:hypothetical protein